MKIATPPHVDAAGPLNDTSETRQFAANNTPNHASFKLNPEKTQKVNAPYSELVIPYFMVHPNNMHLNIRCGPDGIKRAEQDANDHKNFGCCPSLCLPESGEYEKYFWLVKNLTIILSWDCKDTDLQIKFSNYLVYVCKARCIFTLINGVSTKFMDTSKLKITSRIAA